MREPQRPWTDEETQALREMLADGLSRVQMAQVLKRNPGSVKGRLRFINMTPEVRASVRAEARRRERERKRDIDFVVRARPSAARPSEAQFAERDRALSQPLSPSQMLFGDPLPGRSALDKRMGA